MTAEEHLSRAEELLTEAEKDKRMMLFERSRTNALLAQTHAALAQVKINAWGKP